MALAVAGGVVIMVFGIVTARPTMLAMGVPDDIMDDAVLYMNVYYLGIIGNLIYNIGTGCSARHRQTAVCRCTF